MKKLSDEIKHLASVPSVLFNLANDFFFVSAKDHQSVAQDHDDRRIILDNDGNITLNLNSSSVQEEMRQHFADLKKIKLPEDSKRQS
ncbi:MULTISPECIES: hypothetical protein [Nitrincola]|uniref:Uncharacterized protein n=1 Tax=Nitrincola iocasae TaxID=2614693 RepID=A0A5J6LHS7_9GAMM|nr:hypothetical protein [Nitrincola iocasae]QEW08159.1 hypothetical protein F5I99_17585 [Nitrincola iocasae]